MLFSGYKSKQVADTLYISQNTLKFHLKNILSKIEAQNREEVAEIVLKVMAK